ncbi:MAG: peptide deformylase [Bacteroidales bacterium]
MQLPIYLYGQSVLRKQAEEVTPDYPGLKDLISNMQDTLEHADGVGLAAPQVGLPLRLFIVDLRPLADLDPSFADYTRSFINPKILEFSEDMEILEEGCLSVPGINENVPRSRKILLQYQDTDFTQHEEVFEDYVARVIQHEYDHLNGKVFTDRINPIRKQLVKGKLNNIVKGKVDCAYKTKALR